MYWVIFFTVWLKRLDSHTTHPINLIRSCKKLHPDLTYAPCRPQAVKTTNSSGCTVLFAYLIIRTSQLVFSAGTVFFSHNKSDGTVFRLVFSAKQKHKLTLLMATKLYTPRNYPVLAPVSLVWHHANATGGKQA